MAKQRKAPPLILIAEDEALTRMLAVEFLKDAGFDILEASDVASALLEIHKVRCINLVFTDIQMPGDMDGLALAAWLAQHRPSVPVLLTSGFDRPAISDAGEHRQFIGKPYALSTVEQHIREMLHSQRNRIL